MSDTKKNYFGTAKIFLGEIHDHNLAPKCLSDINRPSEKKIFDLQTFAVNFEQYVVEEDSFKLWVSSVCSYNQFSFCPETLRPCPISIHLGSDLSLLPLFTSTFGLEKKTLTKQCIGIIFTFCIFLHKSCTYMHFLVTKY